MNYIEDSCKLNTLYTQKKLMVLMRTIYSLARAIPCHRLALAGKKMHFKFNQSTKKELFKMKPKRMSVQNKNIKNLKISVEYLGVDNLQTIFNVSNSPNKPTGGNKINPYRERFLSQTNINQPLNYQNHLNFEIINTHPVNEQYPPLQERKYTTGNKTSKACYHHKPLEIKEIKPLDDEDEFDDKVIDLDFNYHSYNKPSFGDKSALSSRTNRIQTLDTTTLGSLPSSHENSFELEIESDKEGGNKGNIDMNAIMSKYQEWKQGIWLSNNSITISKLSEFINNKKGNK